MKYFFTALVLFGAILSSACGGSAPSGKPAVQIIAPPYGASFGVGETVGVQSVSIDTNGVTRVELYVDGQLVGAQPAPSAQGEKQFNVVHEWRATTAGAHTLIVRAFNAANVSGEATIPIAVTAPAAVSPTQVIVVTATAPPAAACIFRKIIFWCSVWIRKAWSRQRTIHTENWSSQRLPGKRCP